MGVDPVDPANEVLAILAKDGDVRRVDLLRAQRLARRHELAAGVLGWLYEGLWLIVAAPEYRGDITPGMLR